MERMVRSASRGRKWHSMDLTAPTKVQGNGTMTLGRSVVHGNLRITTVSGCLQGVVSHVGSTRGNGQESIMM